ncbi:hypothetical protein [Catalinimonas alkaloidigena]|nr:hypothetical protein [Catalinimonas alkaloidigena]
MGVVDFQVHVTEEEVYAEWRFLPCFEVSRFVLERSRNGFTFEPVGEVQHLPSRVANKYRLTDRHRWGGVTYYRLKLVSAVEQVEYTSPVAIRVTRKRLVLSPNPWQGQGRLSINASLPGQECRIVFLDFSGHLVYESLLQEPYFALPEEQFEPGIYYYRIYTPLEVLGQGKWKVD